MKLSDYEKIESSKIDFKESVEYNKPKSWLKSVSAFANTSGGVLVFGVRDNDREPVGLLDVVKDSEKISELINSKIVPLPRYELLSFNENGKDFLVVSVGDGPRTPYYYENDGRKEAFIRSGNQSMVAPKFVLDNLILKGQNSTFDELPSKYDISDVSFTLLNASLKRETGKEIDVDKDYISLNLMGSDNKVTNAGLLLCDQGLLEQSCIFCTRWKGNVKGVIDGDALNDKEYRGSLISLLENAETFIKNNSNKSWKIVGYKRIEKEDYPENAVREAIVNAIIHRDYQIIGSEIHIDMFDDRMEITSPGGMVDGSLIQDLNIKKISSIRRNKTISDIFSRLHLAELWGSGLTRIVESYKDCNKKIEFYSDSSTFKVIFPNKNYVEEQLDNKNDNLDYNLNEEDYFIINLFKRSEKTLTMQLMNQIIKLFKKYNYNYEFKREDIEYQLNIKKSRASSLVSLLIKLEIIERIDVGTYKFKK